MQDEKSKHRINDLKTFLRIGVSVASMALGGFYGLAATIELTMPTRMFWLLKTFWAIGAWSSWLSLITLTGLLSEQQLGGELSRPGVFLMFFIGVLLLLLVHVFIYVLWLPGVVII